MSKIAFCINVRDKEQYIARCVRGALSQTYPCSIIISDQQSVDGTLPEIHAAINEFGAPGANIPERPAFRTSFDANEAEYGDEMNTALGGMIDAAVVGGRYADALRAALDKLGVKMQADIRFFIDAGPWEPNAPATVRKKGFNWPLVETRRLYNSIGYRVITGYLGGFGQERAAPSPAGGISARGEVPS